MERLLIVINVSISLVNFCFFGVVFLKKLIIYFIIMDSINTYLICFRHCLPTTSFVLQNDPKGAALVKMKCDSVKLNTISDIPENTFEVQLRYLGSK